MTAHILWPLAAFAGFLIMRRLIIAAALAEYDRNLSDLLRTAFTESETNS